MAITAVDAQAGDVVLMAERHRLLADHARAGDVIGAHEFGPRPAQARHDEDAAKDTHARDGVEAAVEDLRHRLRLGVRRKVERSGRKSSADTYRRARRSAGLSCG